MARTRTPGTVEWGWGRSAVGFKSAYLDFDRGIRVGNLEDHERVTGILKGALESRFRTPFVTERYGRGVFWQWIGYLARENRAAKPISSGVSFGCSKFFIEVDTGERRFKCGLQVERGYVRPPRGSSWFKLRADWDWHRLVAGLRPRSPLMRQLSGLVKDGFEIHAGTWADPHVVAGRRLPPAAHLRSLLDGAAPGQWCGFQAYYALDEAEVRAIPGPELVDIMVAVFDEVAPALSLCSQVPLMVAEK